MVCNFIARRRGIGRQRAGDAGRHSTATDGRQDNAAAAAVATDLAAGWGREAVPPSFPRPSSLSITPPVSRWSRAPHW